MNKKILMMLLLILTARLGTAQTDWNELDLAHAHSVDTITRKHYTLVFISNDSTFNPTVQRRMIDAFFTVYPQEVRTYNRASLKMVVMMIDTAYKGVAATDNGIIRVNPEWLRKHPEDIDIVTHEAMHIVQAYVDEAGPGWVTEGIADYVRYQFGVNNKAGNWALPDFKPQQSYENAYRVTARFFVWIEKHQSKGLVVKLDRAMRTKTYNAAFWKQTTGKTVDELWAMYAANPAL